MGFWGKIGKGWCHFDPNELVTTFEGCYLCATFDGNRLRNATVRVGVSPISVDLAPKLIALP